MRSTIAHNGIRGDVYRGKTGYTPRKVCPCPGAYAPRTMRERPTRCQTKYTVIAVRADRYRINRWYREGFINASAIEQKVGMRGYSDRITTSGLVFSGKPGCQAVLARRCKAVEYPGVLVKPA